MNDSLPDLANSTAIQATKIYNVSEISNIVNASVLSIPGSQVLQVEGELATMRRSPQGHVYFSLKDSKAEIACVMFAGSMRSAKIDLAIGLKVVCRGEIAFYRERCQVQIIVRQIAEAGVGDLRYQFEQMKFKLTQEGLFAAERKRSLPRFVRRVGVVTSPTGAVIHDIIKVAQQRYPGFELQLYPVLVQGEGAASQIAQALTLLNQRNEVDVIIVGRGGGSNSDLDAFNTEEVVRAVAQSNIPVVSAVGHETDFTLCDSAADVRAATPTHAAQLVWADKQQLREYLTQIDMNLRTHIGSKINTARQALANITSRPVLNRPDGFVLAAQQRLDVMEQKIDAFCHLRIASERNIHNGYRLKLEALSPHAVLQRGYTMVLNSDNHAIGKREAIKVGDAVHIRFFDGMVKAVVKENEGIRYEI